MRVAVALTLAIALGGCLSIPSTPTAYNDDACLKRSVRSSGPPPSAAEQRAAALSPSSNCESMRATWARSRSDYPGERFGGGGGEISTD